MEPVRVRHKFTTYPCYDATKDLEVKGRRVGSEYSEGNPAKGGLIPEFETGVKGFV